jgi:hypothetical protein
MKSWHLGIHQDFWLVGRDYNGTYVVPDSNKDVVYKVVGIQNNANVASSVPSKDKQQQQQHALTIIKIPMRLRMTVFPWYGRLLYDTSIAPPRPEHVVHAASDPDLAKRLHTVVLLAIQAGRVIGHLSELDDSISP